MKHIMKLYDSPFERTKSGKKIIEGRLLDEKRRILKEGDELTFLNPNTKEEIKVTITKLAKYKTFAEMYENTNLKDWDYFGTKEEFVSSFYKIYSQEDEKKYGVLAIYFKLI